MSIAIINQQISEKGVAIVNLIKWDWHTERMVVSELKHDHPHITRVTNMYVFGYWLPEYSSIEEIPESNIKLRNYYLDNPKKLLPTPFQVPHNRKEFSFSTWPDVTTYSFRNVRIDQV